jgi:drug/metabolite transporter (DMT)-like permease
MTTRAQHHLAILLVVLAASAWSTAPYFVRVLPYDSWTILFWRGVFGTALITLCLLATQGRSLFADFRNMGMRGWLVASLSTLGMAVFIPALQYTSAANVAVINATGPFVTAALAWLWLRERAHSRTLIACAVALIGVVTIVGGAKGGADLRGIALAGLMTVSIAAMTVIVRRHKETPMAAASALSSLLGSVVSIPFAQSITAVAPHDFVAFVGFGFQIAIGLTFFILGSRFLPSGQAALIATLETPLMPFWIWLAFGDVPAPHQLVGGALVLGAVIADIVGELYTARRTDASALPARQAP